jgi:hypothetical protein
MYCFRWEILLGFYSRILTRTLGNEVVGLGGVHAWCVERSWNIKLCSLWHEGEGLPDGLNNVSLLEDGYERVIKLADLRDCWIIELRARGARGYSGITRWILDVVVWCYVMSKMGRVLVL